MASIKEGLAKSRLPPGNRWCHVATASLAAADAAQKISEVLKTKPVDEALLQATAPGAVLAITCEQISK